MVKEAEVQKKLMVEIMNTFPDIYLRKIHQTQYSHSGIPDLLGCHNGIFFGIEVKTLKGRITKLQQRELDFIAMAGGEPMVCYGIEEIDDIIDRIRKL